MPRALIDTNIWVSALLSPLGFSARMLELLKADQFKPIVSEPMVKELLDVLSCPKLVRKYGLTPYEVAEFAALLDEKAIKVEPRGELRLCRDPKDDIILETALLGNAEYAVSRDDDLKRDLELMHIMREQGVTVVSISQFFRILQGTTSLSEEETG